MFQAAKNVACYLPIRGEVPTQEIIQALWQQKKKCYLPVMQSDKTLRFAYYDANTVLTRNKQQILEPELTEEYIAAEDLDLVLLPLVGVDQHCVRLGYGMGCYDRTFNFLLGKQKKKPYLLGLAYNFQCVDDLLPQPWDVMLDSILTH